MDTAARQSIARAISARLAAEPGAGLLVGGLLGSAARGDDTEWSDLDLLYIVADGAPLRGGAFIFQGAPVSLGVVALGALEAELRRPGPRWPGWMGALETLRPLVGDRELPARLLALGQRLDDRAFQVAVEPALPGLVIESYGRIRSSAVRGSPRDAARAAAELLAEMQTALCLLNRRWLTRGHSAGLEQTFGFALRPRGWEQLAPALWDARELDAIVTTASALMSAYWQLLASCGMMVQNYQKIEDIPLTWCRDQTATRD